MTVLELSRWQFGITTVYHFIFVPLTIGLSILVACMQTAWLVKKDPVYLRMTKFFGTLFLINFAVGVVTGIVEEFQFGMNWSAYSAFVGNVFGAPLATIWVAAIATNLSAYFILAANSWMQHPVGYRVDPGTHRVVLTSIVALLTNSTLLAAWPHVIFASFVIAGMVVIAVSAWHLARNSQVDVFRRAMRIGLAVTLAAGIATAVTGDVQARLMDSQQPMKMAAAEALYNTSDSASFSLFTIGSLNGGQELWSVRVPYLLSLIATLNPHGTVQGINNVERAYDKKYGPGSYEPVIPVTYWSFRLMIGFGMLAALLAFAGLWLTRRRRIPRARWFYRAAIWGVALPYLATTMGWIFTEMGRQPWTVFGLMTTAQSVSPGVTASSVIISMTVFTLLYGAIAAQIGWLTVRHVQAGAPEEPDGTGPGSSAEAPLPVFSY